MADCEERLDDWMEVAKPAMWGTESPFNLVEGGKEGLIKKLCDVTSDVKMFPADKAPDGSHTWWLDSRPGQTSQRPRSRTSEYSSR